MKISSPLHLLALATVSLGFTGCSILKPKTDLTEFFILRASAQPADDSARREPAIPEIRVGPGRIAGYLDNAKIAVQDGANRVDYLDLYRWAEPLSKSLSRTLCENLAQRLNVKHLTLYPDPALEASGFELRYTVDRFEGPLSGAVTLAVSWQIVEYPSSKPIAGKRSVYVVPAGKQGKDVAVYVKRMSDAVGQWANDIAAAFP